MIDPRKIIALLRYIRSTVLFREIPKMMRKWRSVRPEKWCIIEPFERFEFEFRCAVLRYFGGQDIYVNVVLRA
jgi:hypothetical protein